MAGDSSKSDWFVCPACGTVLVGDPDRCSRCGSDEETGWSTDRTADGLDLPDDPFDYEEFLREDPTIGSGRRFPLWIVFGLAGALAAVLLLLAFCP